MIFPENSHKAEYVDYEGKKMVKTFLIEDRRNSMGWRPTWKSIKKYARDFIGMPGITYEECDATDCLLAHTEGPTYEDSLMIQEPYRASTIVDVVFDKEKKTAYAIHDIQTERLRNGIESGEIKYVSPSVWPIEGKYRVLPGRMPNGEEIIDLDAFKPIHLAWVTKPAYGPPAQIYAECDGGEECIAKLRGSHSKTAALHETPAIIRHNGKLHMMSASTCVQREISKKRAEGLTIDDQQLAIAYSICGESKKASCNKCTKAEDLARDVLALKLKVMRKQVDAQK